MNKYLVTIKMRSSVDIEVYADNKESAIDEAYDVLNNSEDKRAEMLDFNNADFETFDIKQL